MTQSAFQPHKRRGLDIIKENEEQKDDDEEDSEGHGSGKEEGGDVVEDGIAVGEKVKAGAKKYVRSKAAKKRIVLDAPARLEQQQDSE